MDQELVPSVSVIIPIYNGEVDLPELLACLDAQTYPRQRVEYCLVDNGSGDRTFPLLQESSQRFATQGLTLRPLTETSIQSSYAARNTGIKASTGEILAFTDADCRPQPSWLEALIQPFRDPAIGMVAGEIVALSGHSFLEAYAERKETLSQKHTLANAYLPYGQTANLALRRSILKQVGLFRPYLTSGGDADLCWRILQSGEWQISLAETAIVRHRHRATLTELRRQWQRYGRSNRYLHDLYGITLTREPTAPEYIRRWSRWLLKEVPITVTKIVSRQAPLFSLLDTPLDLICTQARTEGQRNAVLPDSAHEIDWLSECDNPWIQNID